MEEELLDVLLGNIEVDVEEVPLEDNVVLGSENRLLAVLLSEVELVETLGIGRREALECRWL